MLHFKEEIKTLIPYSPGKPIDEVKRELGLDTIRKMASNENCLGPSKKALAAIREAVSDVHLYPDGSCYYLKRELSRKHSLPEKAFLIGNGSNEIIELLVKGFLDEGKEVLSSEFTFAVYPILTRVYGGIYRTVPMIDYGFDLQAMAAAINKKTRLIFIANPNNPTGSYVKAQEVAAFLEKVPEDVVVCLDEAYYEFAEAKDYYHNLNVLQRNNVIILRTFSKIYGLAGLRIGYGMANEAIISYLDRIRQPFNVNSLAQVGALAALSDEEHVALSQKMVWEGKRYFYEQFEKRSISFVPSQTNFVLVQVPKSLKHTIFSDFLAEGIIVRGMGSYGMPDRIRVTIGTESDNKLFFKIWDQITKQ